MELPGTYAPDLRQYSRRVRGLRYLWGSAGVTQNAALTKPVNLHLINDEAGDPVTVGIQVVGGAKTIIGVLQPGELISVSIADLTGVYAECTTDSIMHCRIH